jgi:putative membrane protein
MKLSVIRDDAPGTSRGVAVHRNARIPLRFAASFLPVGMLTACDDQANGDETGSAAGSAPAGGTLSLAADTISSPLISPDLSDANIVALLDHASDADSSAGALASKKATNAQVKKFALMMMADHHQLRKRGADLAKKLGVTPQPTPDDPITPMALQEMDALEAAEKGLDFDRTYIRYEIAAHRTVLDLADQAQEAAGNAEIKALIERTRWLIDNHLKQAQAIEKELGTPA